MGAAHTVCQYFEFRLLGGPFLRGFLPRREIRSTDMVKFGMKESTETPNFTPIGVEGMLGSKKLKILRNLGI